MKLDTDKCFRFHRQASGPIGKEKDSLMAACECARLDS